MASNEGGAHSIGGAGTPGPTGSAGTRRDGIEVQHTDGRTERAGGMRDRLDRDGDGRLDRDDLSGRNSQRTTQTQYDPRLGDDPRVGDGIEHRVSHKPAKTSAAAVFALVFGLSALISVLTVILSPVALVLGIIGIILGIVGMKMAKRVGVTGRGVAIGGLVLSVLAVLLSGVIFAGATTFLNNEDAVNRLEQRVEDLRSELPTNVEVPESVTP